MKKIEGLHEMYAISRSTACKALEGNHVALIGLIHIPYDNDNNLDETIVEYLQKLEELISAYLKQDHTYTHTGLFKATSNGYKRGDSAHTWEPGDYCFICKGVVIIVTGHVIMVLKKKK